MTADKTTSDDATTRAADWVSTALSIPLIWPKASAVSSLCIIGLVTMLCVAPKFRSDKPPPPNARRIQEMTNAIERADQRVRSQMSLGVQPNPELQGVFQTMRDQPQPTEESP